MKKKFIFLNTQNIDFTQTQGHDYRLVKNFYSFFSLKNAASFFLMIMETSSTLI